MGVGFLRLSIFAAFAVAFAAEGRGAEPGSPSGRVAPRAADVEPLPPGTKIPHVALRDVDGTPVSLHDVTGRHLVALVFYRGGW